MSILKSMPVESIAVKSTRILHALTLGLVVSMTSPCIRASVPIVDPVMVEDFALPRQDPGGWTRLTPSVDSRLIYVDAQSGDDATGLFYSPAATAIGTDPVRPQGDIRPFKTLDAAHLAAREGMPDWILLKGGGIWLDQSLNVKSGRSPAERAVVTVWGVGPRPEIRSGRSRGLSTVSVSNLIILGIRFWAHTRDKDGPYFTGYEGSVGFGLSPRTNRPVRDILIEDCYFRSYLSNSVQSLDPQLPIQRFVMRRSIVSGNYGTTGQGHSQGLWHKNSVKYPLAGVLLEGNFFDHNGWRIQARNDGTGALDGQATIFNHNTYFSDTRGVIFKGNIFARASSINNKWTGNDGPGSTLGIVLDDNLYIEGEIGISIGGNEPGARRFEQVVVKNNVFTHIGRTRPTNRTLSWGMEIKDWFSGRIEGNLVVNQMEPALQNTYGLSISAGNESTTTPGGIEDVIVARNTFANLMTSKPIVSLDGHGDVSGVAYADNIVHRIGSSPLISYSGKNYLFAGRNAFTVDAPLGGSYSISGRTLGFMAWKESAGDHNAAAGQYRFNDDSRTILAYALSHGIASDFDGLIAALHAQSKSNWNPELSAPRINAWLRSGFRLTNLHTLQGSQPLHAKP